MQGLSDIKHVKPNGKCSNCKYTIKRVDKDNKCFFFYPIDALREHRKYKVFVIKCPQCKQYIVI